MVFDRGIYVRGYLNSPPGIRSDRFRYFPISVVIGICTLENGAVIGMVYLAVFI